LFLLLNPFLCAVLLQRIDARPGAITFPLMLMQVLVLPFLLALLGANALRPNTSTRLICTLRTLLNLILIHHGVAILHTTTLTSATAFLRHRHTTAQRSNQNRNHQYTFTHHPLPQR
jgi:hypothetical protein